MTTGGIDSGARTTKAVLVRDGRVLARALSDTGADPAASARDVWRRALEEAGVEAGDVAAVVATGYGRDRAPMAGRTVTEITCQARGGRAAAGAGVRSILDVGGQDSKVIALEPDGRVRDFAMNDRCAAGTGRFLEVMASAFGLDLAEAGRLALAAAEPVPLASTCTVFAESEIVSLRARGAKPEAILAGAYRSVARRLRAMADRVALGGPVAFTGGVARSRAAVAAVREAFDTEVLVPEDPQTTGALGAALIAAATDPGPAT